MVRGLEVAAWPTQAPHIVQLVARVLLNQNNEAGYAAEDELEQELKRHYAGMPASQDFVYAPAIKQELLNESAPEQKDAERHVNSSTKKRKTLSENTVEIGMLILYYLGLLSTFSLLIIGISNQYKLADFFMLCGMMMLVFTGIMLLGMTCLFLWCKGEKLINTDKASLVVLGYCMKGIVIIVGIILLALYANNAPYDPDCPAGAARYC